MRSPEEKATSWAGHLEEKISAKPAEDSVKKDQSVA